MIKFPLPNWIELAPVEMCTRKCWFCPKIDEDEYPNVDVHMPPKLYKKIAKELGEMGYKGTVIICGFGEPLLHKDILSLLKEFNIENIELLLVTNGDLLDKKVVEKLYSSGLDKLIISLYDNEDQKKKFEEMLKDIDKNKYELRDRWGEFKLTNRGGTILTKEKVDNSCYYPGYFMMINWNGDVTLCPQDWRRRVILGNVNYESILDIWNNEEYKIIRKKLFNKQRTFSPCKFCNTNGTLKGESSIKEWEEFYSWE